jgi:hypothetical protein
LAGIIYQEEIVMQTWLKLIGSVDVPITGYPFYGNFKEEFVGFRKTRKPSILLGDHLFLYAPGGSKSIFALAEVISNPKINTQFNPEEEGSCYWIVNIRYLINLPVNYGIHIDEITTKQRKLSKSIQRQSHILLSPEESELALSKLKKRSNTKGQSGSKK